MNIDFKLIEIIEKKILEEKENGNIDIVYKYQDLIIKLYKVIEKQIDE